MPPKKKVAAKPSGPPKPPEPKQTPEESTAIIKGLLTTNNSAVLSSWVGERSSSIDARINELSLTARLTGATSFIGQHDTLTSSSSTLLQNAAKSITTNGNNVPLENSSQEPLMVLKPASASSSRIFSPYGLTSLALPLSFLTAQRRTRAEEEEEESKKKSDAEKQSISSEKQSISSTSSETPTSSDGSSTNGVDSQKKTTENVIKLDPVEAAAIAAKEAVEKARAAAAAAPPVPVQWTNAPSPAAVATAAAATTVYSSTSSSVPNSSSITSSNSAATSNTVAQSTPSSTTSSSTPESSTLSAASSSSSLMSSTPSSQSGQVPSTSIQSNAPLVNPPIAASASGNLSTPTSTSAPVLATSTNGGGGGKPPSRPPSRAGVSAASAAGSRRPSTASVATSKHLPSSSSSVTPSVKNNINDKTPSSKTATSSASSSSSKPVTTPSTSSSAKSGTYTASKQASSSSSSTPKPASSSVANSRTTSPTKTNGASSSSSNNTTSTNKGADNAPNSNNPSVDTQSASTTPQAAPPQQMNMMVPFMVPIPVMITMGPNGPMATALPPPAGGYTSSGGAPSLSSLPQPPSSDATNISTIPTTSSSAPATASAEREVNLLIRVKDLLAQNEALKSELSGLDKSFFDEIEDLKFELAERKKKEGSITGGGAVTGGAETGSAAATPVPPSTLSTKSTSNSRTVSPSKDKDEASKSKNTGNKSNSSGGVGSISPSKSPEKSTSKSGTSSSSSSSSSSSAAATTATKPSNTKTSTNEGSVAQEGTGLASSSSTTSAHVEQGLTVLRKRFDTRWEEGEASALGDVNRSLIGFPLGPDGLPMPAGGMQSLSPSRRKTTSNSATSLDSYKFIPSSSSSSSSALPLSSSSSSSSSSTLSNSTSLSNPQLQQPSSSSQYKPIVKSESLKELRSAWNLMAFGPRQSLQPPPAPPSAPALPPTSATTSSNKAIPPIVSPLPTTAQKTTQEDKKGAPTASAPTTTAVAPTPPPVTSFKPPRAQSAFFPNIANRRDVSATVAAAQDTVESADALIAAVNAVLSIDSEEEKAKKNKNNSIEASLPSSSSTNGMSVEEAVRMTIEAIDEVKPPSSSQALTQEPSDKGKEGNSLLSSQQPELQNAEDKCMKESSPTTDTTNQNDQQLVGEMVRDGELPKLLIDEKVKAETEISSSHSDNNQEKTDSHQVKDNEAVQNDLSQGSTQSQHVSTSVMPEKEIATPATAPIQSQAQAQIPALSSSSTSSVIPSSSSSSSSATSSSTSTMLNPNPNTTVSDAAEKRAADAAREAAEAAAAMQQFLLDMSRAESEMESVAGDGIETTQDVFPHATEEDYLIRVLVRNALSVRIRNISSEGGKYKDEEEDEEEDKDGDGHQKTQISTSTLPSPLSASSYPPTGGSSKTSTVAPRLFVLPYPNSPPVDLLGALKKRQRKALERAFNRFDEKHLHPSSSKQKFVPSISKVKELQMSAISSYDFERGLLSLGLTLSPDEVAALVGGLRLDVHGMINHSDFVRFVSLPIISKPEDADTLIASVIRPPPSSLPKSTSTFSGVTEEAASFSIKVPRPVHAQPSPIYRERYCPPSPRQQHKYEKKIPPPQKMNSAWAYADAETARKRPLVHVPWPCLDLNSAQSAFWAGVNKLEQQMLREVRLRAEVKAEFKSSDEVGNGSSESGGAPGTVDLRRAYLFFDRRGKRALQIEDLHETLADLGLVDRMPRVLSWGAELEPLQPVQPKVKRAVSGPLKGEDDPHSWDYIDVDDDGGKKNNIEKPAEESGTEKEQPTIESSTIEEGEGENRLQLIGLSSPSRRTAVDAPRSVPPLTEIVNDSNPRDAISLLGDPLAADLANGARAMVVALFNRLHGASDPGNTGVDLGSGDTGRALVLEAKDGGNRLSGVPITFNVFARWAAPLNTNLRRLREKVQSMFLAQATVGGGGKDFDRAFRRIDKNGDGSMSLPEFREVLGPLLKALSPTEMQNLCDYFDTDGSGEIDFKEFLGMTSERAAQELAIELDDDEPL